MHCHPAGPMSGLQPATTIAIAGLSLLAMAVLPTVAAAAQLFVQGRNELGRPIMVECQKLPAGWTATVTVQPGASQQVLPLSFSPFKREPLTVQCSSFEHAGGNKGASIFPQTGTGGYSPISVNERADGGDQVITYVAKMPAPHYEGAN